MEKRDNFVDYARLGLALSVALSHLPYGLWPSNGYRPLWAVPAFLSISGFYVLRSYERSDSWRQFIKKRLLRIMPAFTVSLLIVAAAGGAFAVLEVLKCYASLGLAPESPHLMNAASWSLGAEEVAYGILAVLFTLGLYRAKWPIWIAFGLSCILLAAMPVDSHLRGVLNIVPAFFAGSLAYIHRDRLKGQEWPLGLLIPLAIVGAIWLTWGTRWHWIPGVCIGVGVLAIRGLRLPKLPDLSYGCYIYHLPLFFLLLKVEGNKGSAPLYLGLLALFCAGSWYLIEKPALRLKARKPAMQPRPPHTPAEALTATCPKGPVECSQGL